MKTQYIFTADDFGPINFINRGIFKAVKAGLINSVQVLTNGDTKDSLKEKLRKLADCVDEGKTLDLGLHLTLTSGKPLHKGDWGEMLDNEEKEEEKKKNFKDFTKFDFSYETKIETIKKEFAAQKKQLVDALDELGSDKLVLSSVSNHHNIMSIGTDIFEAYLEVGKKEKLSYRSLKAIPSFSMWIFYNVLLPGSLLVFGNKSDKKEHRKEMRKMNKAFKNTNHFGDKDIELKSPSYLEAGFYKGLGTKGRIKKMREGIIKRRAKKLFKMVEGTVNSENHKNVKPDGKKIIEFVFHLGDKDDFRKNYSSTTKNYSGVTDKYFDNRIVEYKSLERLKKGKKHDYTFDNFVSWKDCGIVTYKAL